MWENPYTRPYVHDANNLTILEYTSEPNKYGARRAKVKCDGVPGYSGGCCGTYRDPSADGHGGLNGGGWVSCSNCQGRGHNILWVKDKK